MVENKIGRHIKILRLDQGREYTSRYFINIAKIMGLRNSTHFHIRLNGIEQFR